MDPFYALLLWLKSPFLITGVIYLIGDAYGISKLETFGRRTTKWYGALIGWFYFYMIVGAVIITVLGIPLSIVDANQSIAYFFMLTTAIAYIWILISLKRRGVISFK